MSRHPLQDPFTNLFDRIISSSPPLWAAPMTSSPPTTLPPGIDVVVRLSVAVIQDPDNNGMSVIQVLSPYNDRIPVPLDHVRSFTGVKRCLRNLLKDTLAQYGVSPSQMTKSAAFLPVARYPTKGGLVGITDDPVTWQNYINVVASLYHATCATSSSCATCKDPAHIIACFSSTHWTSIPLDTGLVMRDDLCAEHQQTLHEISIVEEARYVAIVQDEVNTESATSERVSRQNSTKSAASRPRTTLKPAATRGPKGRSLIGPKRSSSTKVIDYSRGTLFPSTAHQGIKAESDMCLTCLRYGRSCKGTTMTFVKSSRSDRPSQWKCECCQNPQRRCVWRRSLDKVTSYEEEFAADGGVKLPANTVQGRLNRAITRDAEMSDDEVEEQEGDEDAEDLDEEDGDIEQGWEGGSHDGRGAAERGRNTTEHDGGSSAHDKKETE